MRGPTLRALAIVALLLVPTTVRGEEIPAWLKSSMGRSVPEGIDRESIVYLINEQMVDVSGSTVTSRFREAFRVTGAEGKGHLLYAPQAVDEDFKVTGAWKVTPTGDVEAFGKKAIDQHDADTTYRFSMRKLNVLNTGGSRVGDIVAWEYTLKSKPEAFIEGWTFGTGQPTLVSRFGIRLPRDWHFRTVDRNLAGLKPFIDDEGYTVWEMREIRRPDQEPMGAPRADLLPTLRVSYGPSRAHAARFDSWEKVGRWYAGIMEKQMVADRSVRSVLEEITQGSNGTLESILMIARFVQDVRYLNVAIGRSVAEPHPAPLILKNRFGDCEDKTVLTITMLRELGVEAYPILVLTSDDGSVWTELPSPLQFNHVIVGVRTGSDQVAAASFQAGPLGRLVAFDPTSAMTGFGDVPWYLQGVSGVVSHETHGGLVTLPVLPPESSRREAELRVSFPDRGGIDVKATITHSGQYAASMRAHYESVRGIKREEEFLTVLKARYGHGELRGLNVSGADAPGADLVLSLDFWMPLPGMATGDLMTMATRFALSTRAARIPEAERASPLVIASGYQESERTIIQMPDGWEMVPPLPSADEESPIGRYSVAAGLEGNRLLIERWLTVRKTTVAPELAGSVKSFFDSVIRSDDAEFALRKSGSGP